MRREAESEFDWIYYNECEAGQPIGVKTKYGTECLCELIGDLLEIEWGEEEHVEGIACSRHQKHQFHGKKFKLTLEIIDS